MDRPIPEGVTVHRVGNLSLMGAMGGIPGFKWGDWIHYGGMIYKPESGRYAYTVGDYATSYGLEGGSCWPGESGVDKHYMNVDHKGGFLVS